MSLTAFHFQTQTDIFAANFFAPAKKLAAAVEVPVRPGDIVRVHLVESNRYHVGAVTKVFECPLGRERAVVTGLTRSIPLDYRVQVL